MYSGFDDTLTLTVVEAARFLGISRGLAYEAVRRGEIPSIRVGRRILIPRVALQQMLTGEMDLDGMGDPARSDQAGRRDPARGR